jgi:hypothetical protein
MYLIYIFKTSVPKTELNSVALVGEWTIPTVSTTKPNRLMLFGETVAVYWENHTEHTNTLCGQNIEFWYVNASGTYTNH